MLGVCCRLALHIHPGPALRTHTTLALHILKLSFVGLDVNPCSPAPYGAASLKWGPKAQPFSSLFGPRSHSGMPSHGAPCRATTLGTLPHTKHLPQSHRPCSLTHRQLLQPEEHMPGMPRQLQGWGAQTSLLMEPGCRSSSSPAGSTAHPLGCGERAAVERCILQPSKGHKHQQTPAQRWWGCPSTAVVPPGHPCPTQGELAGSPLLEGHRGAKQARGSLPALALLVLGERHLHIGCLPVWLYLQELKEEQRLLPGQRQEGAGRAPTALPRHPSLSSRADACLTCSSGPPAVETPPPHAGSTGQARPPRWLGRLCQCRPVSLGL